MKHEAELHNAIPTVENPGSRTSGNEGQTSNVKNPAFLGRLREKAAVAKIANSF